MCELLVRTVDRGCGHSFAGDVIHVADDGWNWGAKEKIAPFRIIALPGVSPFYFADMLEGLRSGSGAIISKREAYFDLDVVGASPTLDDLLRAKRKRHSAGLVG